MNFSQRIPFETLMEPVALRLLGEPNKALSKYPTDMRWGTHGSLSVNFETGEFYDHENNEGGGVIDFLIKYKRGDDHAGAMSWLRREGMLNGSAPRQPPARPQRLPTGQQLLRPMTTMTKTTTLFSRLLDLSRRIFGSAALMERADGFGI